MRILRSSLLLVLGLAVLVVLQSACARQDSTWDHIQDRRVLRVGLDPTYPPFEFFDGLSLHGIDVDLVEAIAAEKGLVVEYSYFGFDGLYDALATEQVDILMSALTPDLSRTRDFAYSDGYVESGLVLVSLASQPYRQIEEMSGRRIAVELGAAGHVEATTWQRQVQDLAISTFNGSDEALQALADGIADAAVVDNITFRLFEGQATSVKLIAAPLTSEPYAIVVRRQDEQLLAQLNDALSNLRQSGKLDAILNAWFSG